MRIFDNKYTHTHTHTHIYIYIYTHVHKTHTRRAILIIAFGIEGEQQ